MAKLVSKVYADALFEAAIDVQNMDQIYEELGYVCQAIESNPELERILQSPEVSDDEKKSIISEVFGSSIGQEVHNFIKILLDKGRGSELLNIRSAFETRYHAYKKVTYATVESAVRVSEEDLAALNVQLSKMTGTQVIAENVIDPSVVGGIVVRMGDKVIDGSVRRRISELKEELTQLIV